MDSARSADGNPGDALPVGSVLGRYEILDCIAAGGMATVYVARARGTEGFERIVAIKHCHAHLRSSDEFVEMFLDEARLAAKIHHPHVVPVLDVGDRTSLYLVMEYIEGDRLSGLVHKARRTSQPIPTDIAIRIISDGLSGLHCAHTLCDQKGNSLHIVHRDVTPANILIGIDGLARITDFGVAKSAARMNTTREGVIKGKLAYLAPEQLEGGAVDQRLDVFAMGIVLWETLTGLRLFQGDSESETLARVRERPVPAPSLLVETLPVGLDAVVLKALERDREKRYQSAAEFAEALESVGITPASTRAVAKYVRSMTEGTLARRREAIRTAADAAKTVVMESNEPSGLRGKPARSATPPFGMPATIVNMRAGESIPNMDVATDTSVSAVNVPMQSRRWVGWVTAVAVLTLAGGGAFWVSTHRGLSPTAAAPAPLPRASTPETPVTNLAHETPVAPSTAAPTEPPASPPAATEAAPSGTRSTSHPAATATASAPAAHPVTRRSGRSAPAPRAASATTSAQQSHAAQPAAGGEFAPLAP